MGAWARGLAAAEPKGSAGAREPRRVVSSAGALAPLHAQLSASSSATPMRARASLSVIESTALISPARRRIARR